MVGVDRFGGDYEATAADGRAVVVRVPFPEPAGSTDDVRRYLVAAVRAARAGASAGG
jgi:hypothetical protein